MDCLTVEEIEWLDIAREDNNGYKAVVDNDAIWIETIDENPECRFTFDNYGQDFIVQLLNYIGCNAEHV